MQYQHLTYEVRQGIAFIGFGKFETKSMTTLTKETLLELKLAVDELKKNSSQLKGACFFSHKKDVFLAGVDVTIINSLTSEAEAANGAEQGQLIYNLIEDLPFPTAALVDGVCLGGGLELSLACKKIFVSDSPRTVLGLPEVMLGVLPGFGGTYRLPKKIGLAEALPLILTGKQVKGRNAVKLGLAEVMLPAERMLELAPTYLLKPTKKKKFTLEQTLKQTMSQNFITRKIIFQKAREQVLKESKGFYPSPLKILEVIENGFSKSREKYLRLEAEAFGFLSQTEESKNLQHIFFMTDKSKKLENKDQLPDVSRAAVLGAGVMGGGIAWLLADNDQAPLMKDINQAGLELGLKQASANFGAALKRKRINEDEFNRKMRSINPLTTFEGFKGVDLVIEAVVENMEVKKKVFADCEKEVRENCLITSNTSSLSVTEMCSNLKDSSRFAGLHFFNPVHKMPLVEIIRHPKVSQKTIDTLYKWALDVKKTPIVVNDGPGFLVNRILAPYLNEAAFLLKEGVSIEDLDQAALNFGMPMGPCRLMDEIGIDVCDKVGKIMQAGLGARAIANDLSHQMVDKKILGKKNQKGFYLYDEKGKSIGINDEVLSLLPKETSKMDEMTIQMRLILPMINEASYCLADKIVEDASTIDMGVIYGLGFPPFKGGLLKYADHEGLDRLVEAMEEFSTVSLERYKVSPLLKELASQGKFFYHR